MCLKAACDAKVPAFELPPNWLIQAAVFKFGPNPMTVRWLTSLHCRMKSLAQLLTRSRSSSPSRFPCENNVTQRYTIFTYKVSISQTKAPRRICEERSVSFSAPSRKIRHSRVHGLGSQKFG